MRTALAPLLLALVLVSSAAAEPYQWTISASSTDPYVNTGVPTPGVYDLFLWLVCAGDGASVLEFGLDTTNGQIVGFDYGPHTPIPGGVAFAGCLAATPQVVLRMIAFDEGQGVNVCFFTGGIGTLGVRNCQPGSDLFPMAWIGFSSDGTPPCTSGVCDGPVSVDASAWGSIKALYR